MKRKHSMFNDAIQNSKNVSATSNGTSFDIEQLDWQKQQKKRRLKRLSSLMRTEIAKWLQEHFHEPGVVVSVTRVDLHKKFSKADIFVLVYPAEKEKDVLKKLRNIKKELRYHLAQTVRFKRVPELTISKDTQELTHQRVEGLLDKIKD